MWFIIWTITNLTFPVSKTIWRSRHSSFHLCFLDLQSAACSAPLMYYSQISILEYHNRFSFTSLMFAQLIIDLSSYSFLLLLRTDLLFLFSRLNEFHFSFFLFLYIILWILLESHEQDHKIDIYFIHRENYLEKILNLRSTNHRHVFQWILK
jgi:hypothetical protein